jgi:uncharacterized membrane protein YfcA
VTGRERAIAIAAGAAAGFFGGLFGVGGGVILVPLLTGRLRFTQHQAHGTSLAVIGVTAIVSVAVYAAHGNVRWGVAILVGLLSAVSARWGARLANTLSAPALTRTFAVFLLLVAARLLASPQPASVPVSGAWAIALDLALGLAVGLLAGFMGVGGGILAVPAFSLLLGMTQTMAQGSSLLVILFAAPAGAIEHGRRGNVVLRFVPWLALGAAIAGPFSSWWVQRLPRDLLTRAFGVFLIVNGVWTWIRANRQAAAARPTVQTEAAPGR